MRYKQTDRRAFLKEGAAGAIGVSLAVISSMSPTHVWASTATEGKAEEAQGERTVEDLSEKPRVTYRTLGKTGMKVSMVSIGAMQITDVAVLHKALDLGINYIDTARGYQGGNNEKMVGQVLKTRRKETYVATKIPLGDTPRYFVQQMETSLKSLQTDYIDVLFLHNVRQRDQVMNQRAMEAFARFKKEGKTRFVGVSTHSNEVEVVNAAVESKFWDVVLVKFNFESTASAKEALKKASAASLGVVAMKTQAGGYQHPDMGNLSPHQAALKWVLQYPYVHTTIPGMLTVQQVTENAKVMGSGMSWHDRKTLDRYARAIDKLYCRMCGACERTCPNQVAIPEVMRCMMYAEGYGDLPLGQAEYRSLPASASAVQCQNCTRCVAQCVNGLKIGQRMAYAHGLLG